MFYSKPTTLEPPGTIFRIDAQKTKYIVGELKVQVQKGKEVFGKSQERIQASMGVLAKILGVNVNINLGGRRAEQLEFEMTDPARETVMDMEIDLALKPFLEKLEYRTDNRYFIIRESRIAMGIKYRFSEGQISSLGGDAAVMKAALVKGTLFASQEKNQYELLQEFDQAMRVMFLPEEIKPITAGLSGERPELGRIPVKEELTWNEEL
jgi:hypothetical protein